MSGISGHLAFVGSHTVNGVSEVHTSLMKDSIFAGLNEHFPGRIIPITNGVTPRRWLHEANPSLANLITSRIGPEWIRDLDRLGDLEPLAEDPGFCEEFGAVKRANKARLAGLIRQHLGLTVDASEKILIGQKGKDIPILKTVLPIHLEGEEVLLEAFVDISELKKTAAELQVAKESAEKAEN